MSQLFDNLLPIQQELQKFLPEDARTRSIFPVTKMESFTHSELRLPVYDVDDKTASVIDPTDYSLPTKFISPSKKNTVEQSVLTIACAVKYTRIERMAASNCHQWDLARIAAAKRAIYLQEERIAFLGEPSVQAKGKKYVRGILDESFWSGDGKDKGKVEEVTSVSSKKKWSQKSSDAIFADIEKALAWAGQEGLYAHPKVLVVPYEQYLILHQPLGSNFMSIASFLANEIGMEVHYSKYLKGTNHGLTHNSVSNCDLFLCFPKTPEVLSLFITQDVQASEGSYDGLENLQLSVWEKTSGVIPSKLQPLYLGRGI